MLNPELKLLHCTVQSILYQKLPEPNWLDPGDHSHWLHAWLDPCGALNLVCSRQLVSDRETGQRIFPRDSVESAEYNSILRKPQHRKWK